MSRQVSWASSHRGAEVWHSPPVMPGGIGRQMPNPNQNWQNGNGAAQSSDVLHGSVQSPVGRPYSGAASRQSPL